MIPNTLEEVYAAKRERRKQLAALPINERVQIIEKLHEFGLLMRKAREKSSTRRRDNEHITVVK